MSASYINRDPIVLNQQASLQKLPGRMLENGDRSMDYANLNDFQHRPHSNNPIQPSTPHTFMYDGFVGKSSPPATPFVNSLSPKMSPDSTLCHPYRYPQTSPKLCSPQSASSSTCDSFLRTALLSSGFTDRSCVGSSTTLPHASSVLTTPPKCDATQLDDRSMFVTSCNISPASTDTHCLAPVSSVSVPSSTTPVKKSSRRNPWGSETYSDLITVAIHSYPDKQATLQQIYDFIITHYDYFRERSDPASSAGWKNSIRHNLSLHDRFAKCPKSSDNTKSSYWRINTEAASKPYIRRRTSFPDGMKRSAGSGGGSKTNRSGSRSARQNDKMLPRNGPQASHTAPLPSLNELHQSYRTNANMFQPYALSAPGSGCNGGGGVWKPSTHLQVPPPPPPLHRPPYASNATAFRQYPYDQSPDTAAFDLPEFHAMMSPTDQALVRSRANSLIEHLLRGDNPSFNQQQSSPDTHTSQPYLPNAFLTGPSSAHRPPSATPVQLSDPRARADLINGGHLPSVYFQSTDAAFGASSPWQNYASINSRIPSTSYASLNEISPYIGNTTNSVDVKSNFDRAFTSNAVAPRSPSTNSSTSSSTRSWRPCLGLEPLMQSDGTRQALSTAVFDHHPIPMASIYHYSTGTTDLPNHSTFTSTDCALDTPPYQHIKPEPMDDRTIQPSAAVRSEASMDPFDRASGYQPSLPATSEFAFNEDPDRDKLELELSLELAERIVASTRPAISN